jgi:hypothetical protein
MKDLALPRWRVGLVFVVLGGDYAGGPAEPGDGTGEEGSVDDVEDAA